jgi:hypothetical protein
MGSNAALVIDNLADDGVVSASTQALAMPAAQLQSPHPSERWRSVGNSAFIVLDKLALLESDTVMLCGLTCGSNTTIRLRLSSIDASGAAGDMLDTGVIANGAPQLDVEYGAFVYLLDDPASSRFTRIDISDPDADFVEAGILLDGLREEFTVNFAPGAGVQYVDRSRISNSSSGQTLTWTDNTFRRVDMSFPWVEEDQRYGLIERLDRVKGKHENVLLIMEPSSSNLPRSSIYGLMTDLTPATFGVISELFGKQLRMDERI